MNQPDIIITRRDLDRLDALLGGAVLDRTGKIGEFLLNEITRARIVEDSQIPPNVVTMGAIVQFRDEESGRVNVGRLLFPRETASRGEGISVLTPVGAALLGLSENQSIEYETLDGRLKTLTVLKVLGRQPDDSVPKVREEEAAEARLS